VKERHIVTLVIATRRSYVISLVDTVALATNTNVCVHYTYAYHNFNCF